MRTIAVLVGLELLAACAVESGKGELPDLKNATQPMRWSAQDAPELLAEQLTRGLDTLPQSGAVERTPWPGSYWPTAADSIAYRWAGAGSLSPAEKYERAFGGSDVERRVSEHFGVLRQSSARACTSDRSCNRDRGEVCARRRGETSGRCIPTWYGICHAWAAAAVLEPEPQTAVTVNGVTFGVNDIKALASLAYDQPEHRRVSLRCNKSDTRGQIAYDRYGRPSDQDAACRDTNAGTFHLLVTNLVGLQRIALLEDRAFDEQVWTYPISSYQVVTQREVDAGEANALVGANGGSYRFNSDAKYFVQVQMRVKYVDMVAANASTDRPLAGQVTGVDTLEYLLELDAAREIIGGEWLGESKRTHPDFLWLPTGVGQESVAGDAIRYAAVKQLVDGASSATGPAPAPGPGSPAGAGVTHLDEAGYVGLNQLREHAIDLPAGYEIVVQTEAQNDVDLYVRFNAPPRGRDYDAYSNGFSGDEQLSYVAPTRGTLYIVVHGYEASSYKLTTSGP